MADWDLPLGADARSLSSSKSKYDAWDDNYESIHNTGNSNRNTVDSSHNTGNVVRNTIDDYEGWIPAKTKSSRAKEAAKNACRDGKQQFSEGKRNNSKHSQKKNKTKYVPQADNNNDFWNTHEADNHTSRQWNFTNNSSYVQASAPVVNVWEQRIKRSEEIKSMEPVNETEEEAMIRHAIELSKLEALKDEENQKRLAKEYELQMQLLASNPEIVEDISEAFVDISPSNPSTLNKVPTPGETSNDFKSERKTEEIPQNAVYSRNEKKNMGYGGAKPKFGRIIEAFGGWGIKEDVPETPNESNDCWEESGKSWDEPDRNNYDNKATERNSSSAQFKLAKSQKKQSSGGWGIKDDVPETLSENNDCWEESSKSWDEPDKNNYDNKATERNSSSEQFKVTKSQKKQSSGGWGIKDNVAENPSELKDSCDEPDRNTYGAKTESNDCWGELDKNNYVDQNTEKTCLSKYNKTDKPLEKQSNRRKNLTVPSSSEPHEDYAANSSNLASGKKNEKKYSKQNDNQCEQFSGDAKSDFTFVLPKEVEPLHAWDEIGKNDNFPSYSDVNLKVSKDSAGCDAKNAVEFDEFIQELKKDVDESNREIEENNCVKNEFWEDKKSVHLSNSNWEHDNYLVGSSNNTFNQGKNYDLFSSDGFDSLSINSSSKPDKHDVQDSQAYPETSNVSTCNTNEFLYSSVPNKVADKNLLADDISNSSRYGDFQVNQGHEINAQNNDVYDRFTLKMSSDPKQTLVDYGDLQSEDPACNLPPNTFLPAEENLASIQNNPAFNQTASPYLPNMPLGTPLMPMAMPLSPTLMSPYTNPMLLQQMLLLNNPFFVKQLQALDMYYRSMGMPCSALPFATMQMPLVNSSLQDPNFLINQNQVPIENEPSIPHDMLFSTQKEVPERRGVVSNPPGLNDLVRTEKQIDTLQQAEINSFLDKYCDNDFEDDVAPIPPPKPATSKCSDSSTLESESSALGVSSGDPFCIVPQKNVGVSHTSTKSYDDLVPLNVKQNALQKEHVGWGDLDDDTSAPQHRKKYMWSEESDGWGMESSTKLVRKSSNMEVKNKPMNRQPSSQPIVGRYKR